MSRLISCVGALALVAGAAHAATPNYSAMTGADLWRAADHLCRDRDGLPIQMRAAAADHVDRSWAYTGAHSPAEEAAHAQAVKADQRQRTAPVFGHRAAEFAGLYAELIKRTPAPSLDAASQAVLVSGTASDASDVEAACKVLTHLAEVVDAGAH